jgi:hypothetical protein
MTRQDHYLVIMAKRQRFQSAVRPNTDLPTAAGECITPQTVRKRLLAANHCAFRLAVHPKLTPRHRTTRLPWAWNYGNCVTVPLFFLQMSRTFMQTFMTVVGEFGTQFILHQWFFVCLSWYNGPNKKKINIIIWMNLPIILLNASDIFLTLKA